MIIDGIIETSNSNDNYINLVIKSSNNTMYNVKTSKDLANSLKENHVYRFIVDEVVSNRKKYVLKEVIDLSKINDFKRDEILRNFLPHKEMDAKEAKNKLFNYINNIIDPILHDITKTLVERNAIDFLTYPAGTRIHHNFLGGLVYHTLGMLDLAKGCLNVYPYLNQSYLYAGIILHDLAKIKEFTDVQSPEYSLEGQMLGHLVMGAILVNQVAKEKGYENSEEVLILEHILISHHGQLQLGSAKKPLTAEALLIWYLDTIDSKFQVIGDELAKIDAGNFTDTIPIIDRMKLYKVKEDNSDKVKEK